MNFQYSETSYHFQYSKTSYVLLQYSETSYHFHIQYKTATIKFVVLVFESLSGVWSFWSACAHFLQLEHWLVAVPKEYLLYLSDYFKVVMMGTLYASDYWSLQESFLIREVLAAHKLSSSKCKKPQRISGLLVFSPTAWKKKPPVSLTGIPFQRKCFHIIII